MKIIKFEPTDTYRVQQFIDLPFRIYKDIQQWVPPLAPDSKAIFDLKKNPFYKHSVAAFFLAMLTFFWSNLFSGVIESIGQAAEIKTLHLSVEERIA